VVLLLAIYEFWMPAQNASVRYDTVAVKRGDLTVTVSATGTVQPVNQVDVGSELSGTIESVLVDYNQQVKRGQILARLDTDRLKAQVIQGQASLSSARAKVAEAKATVEETRLRYERCKKLAKRQLCSKEDLDSLLAAKLRAQAGKASSEAQVAVAQATLDAFDTSLAKADIRSPIDGLVLKRQIEPGQTVAASLQAPVLFTLAEDLTKMQLLVAVDEADVGKIAENQQAVFTVDAYPDRRFPATISQVRYAPQTIDGVVTYETVLSVDNADLSLRPGMTATAVVTVQQLHDVMLVPNAALRFTPPETKTTTRSNAGIFAKLFRRPHRQKRQPEISNNSTRKVWILKNDRLVAVQVKTGASDGKFTVVQSKNLQPGDNVVVEATSIKK
jgi:HlyD family secretion protein